MAKKQNVPKKTSKQKNVQTKTAKQPKKPVSKPKQSVQGQAKPKNKSVKPKSSPKAKKEDYPHFRRYRKSGHPTLIVDEHSDDEYKYRKVMHSERDGRHLNEKIEPNPNPTDPEPMYIAKRERHDKKKHFEKRLPWEYPKKKDKKK